ncbi:putative ataxin-10 [Iris pallida]|uniref:Ataxin-10 n=1 Tax=Iris pallida TaxID=29817 RepID=A0AAX6FT44_IRIPA|nr:putative ataxin-10 [Iris pallida]
MEAAPTAPVEEAPVGVEGDLESLLEDSRTPEGRSRLAAIPSLLPSLLLPSLLLPTTRQPHLRLLRNLLAGEDSPHLEPFLRFGGPQRISSLLEASSSDPQLLRAALQVLANLSLSSSSLWAPPLLSPSLLLSLSRVRHSRVLDLLCMLLYNSSSSLDLSDPATSLPVLAELIATASTVGYQEEWLEWLLARICVEEPHFHPLFRKLRLPEQAFLLRILTNTLTSRSEEVAVTDGFALAVLEVAREAYTAAAAAAGVGSGCGSALPTRSPATDVLGYSLTILRDVCAWEDPDLGTEAHPVDSLLSSGLLEFMLTAIGELGPPSIIRKCGPSASAGPAKACPYKGFRRDVVSVIANCLHRRKRAQDEVRKRSGIFLLMQQCVVDDDNPFLREWGLLAIRNLLEGNAENQREVSELQLQGPVDTSEITELGLKVEVDEKSGRAKLVNIS